MLQAFARPFPIGFFSVYSLIVSELLPQSTLFLMTRVSGTFIPRQGLRGRTNLVYSDKVKIKTVGYTIGNMSYAKWDSKMCCQLSIWHTHPLPSFSFRSSLPACRSHSSVTAEGAPGVILPERTAYMAYSLPGYTLSASRNHVGKLHFQNSS